MKVQLHSQSHEWRRRDEDGTVNIIRAEWDSINWHFRVTTKKDPDWHPVDIPTVELFEELREVLFNKYQRGRMPWSYVESLDKKIADMRDGGE